MVKYKVTVFTSDRAWSDTCNYIYIRLVGTDGESEKTQLPGSLYFGVGAELQFNVTCAKSIGELILIELDKQPYMGLEDSWFPAKVEVKSPEEDTYIFPIHHWIIDSKEHCFREGKALRFFDEPHNLGKSSRERELKERKDEYCWSEYREGLPHCMKANDVHSLPAEVVFSFTKETEFGFTATTSWLSSKLCGLLDRQERWPNIDDISRVFKTRSTNISEYVHDHWKDDAFFAYQFLNGVNPLMIRRCKALPKNFPVTDSMVFLHGQSSLAQEIKKGNIFLCDYKILDGIPTNRINGKKQYLTAPLVLLHKTDKDELQPIAIQLQQEPAEDNPIFFPTDSEYDWLLAKIFVRSADFNLHEVASHLLRTHLLAEVFAVSLLRNVPMVHPLYKLLIPHTRYTLHINLLAREKLISRDGILTKMTATGGEGMLTILKRSLSALTYSSLCLPDDIADRGLEDVPQFYYRDNGLKLWKIIHKFVTGILGFYYKKDSEVQEDTEVQNWIRDIFEHGFLSKLSTGIPQRFSTVDGFIKFVTMVIFTVSAQHAAVNSGQYDYGGWMPNSPPSLQQPPPTKKDKATEETVLKTLPDINTTVLIMDTLWLLSQPSSDFVALGDYPEDHFTEKHPCELIKEFQGDLKVLSTTIKVKNENRKLQYNYLDPEVVEKSVAI